jgi:hypothetical protein
MLSQAGYDAPADLMAADAVNPSGYWESKGLFHRNDTLLEQLGSRWDHPERLPPGWEDSEAAITWRQGVLRHLETVFAGARAPLIKDPRLCVLLPGWLPWLESGCLRVEMMLTLRHPLEVASSLEKAQNLPSQEGLRLWLHHVLAAERVSRGWPRLLLRFDELIGDPDASLQRCLQLLARPSEGADLNRAAADFVLPQLHRQRSFGRQAVTRLQVLLTDQATQLRGHLVGQAFVLHAASVARVAGDGVDAGGRTAAHGLRESSRSASRPAPW